MKTPRPWMSRRLSRVRSSAKIRSEREDRDPNLLLLMAKMGQPRAEIALTAKGMMMRMTTMMKRVAQTAIMMAKNKCLEAMKAFKRADLALMRAMEKETMEKLILQNQTVENRRSMLKPFT